MAEAHDIIDALGGIAPGSPVDDIRSRRPEARANAQRSYRALFQPDDPGSLSRPERFAVATFVAGLHRQGSAQAHYQAELAAVADPAIVEAVGTAIASGATAGPYGAYPSGPLSREDQPGLHFRLDVAALATVGPRLAAALDHAHLLVFRPRDSSPEALQRLLDAGFDTTAVVTLSQLVAFLTFQVRVVVGLAALADAGDAR
jgi:CMD domain protein